jgi:hypothetical protein
MKFTIDYALFKMENSNDYKIESYSLVTEDDKVVLSNLNFERSGVAFSVNRVEFSNDKINVFSMPYAVIDEIAIIIDNKDLATKNIGGVVALNNLLPNLHINKLLISSYFMSEKVRNILLSNIDVSSDNNLEIKAEKVFFDTSYDISNNESSNYLTLKGAILKEKSYIALTDEKNSIKATIINNKPEYDYSIELNLAEDFNQSSILGLKRIFNINFLNCHGGLFLRSSQGIVNHEFKNFVISHKDFPLSFKLDGPNDKISVKENNMAYPSSGDGSEFVGSISWILNKKMELDIKEFTVPFLSGKLNIEKSNINLLDDSQFIKGALENIKLEQFFYKDTIDKKHINSNGLFSGTIDLNSASSELRMLLSSKDNGFISGIFNAESPGKFYAQKINITSLSEVGLVKKNIIQKFDIKLFGNSKKELLNKKQIAISTYYVVKGA